MGMIKIPIKKAAAVANTNTGSTSMETPTIVEVQADPAGATPVVAESEHPEMASATEPINHVSAGVGGNTLKTEVAEHKPATNPEVASFSPENKLPAKDVIKDYPVGYKKPPKNNQFKPGQSGNPKGGKKKIPNFSDVLMAQLDKKVPVIENGKHGTATKKELVINSMITNAIKGKPSSMNLLLKLYEQAKVQQKLIGAGDVVNFSWDEHKEKMWRILEAETKEFLAEESDDDDDGSPNHSDSGGSPAAP